MIKKILLALYSTLLMFGLTLTVSAKSLRCEYIIKTEGTPSVPAGQDLGVIFTIDENDVFTKELKIPKDIQNRSIMGAEIKLNSVNDKPSDSGSTGNEKKPTNPTTSTSEIGVRKLQDNFCNKTAGIWQLVGYALMALKIIIPIIIIVLGVVNFSKAAIVSDKDAIKKASITLLQKLIFGICIFFVPTIVNLLVSLISDFAGNQDSVGVCQYCLLDPLSSTCKNVINSNK